MKPRIPRGWRKLPKGTVLRNTDHAIWLEFGRVKHAITMYPGKKVEGCYFTSGTYIRRVKRGKGKR